ncbi:uncharacterized protein LOC124645459 [Helicoverpa zea]|uniref:uncharacterized protein LOC124645459 n=1 Tax=Helicoverpa zea TaxID=7113 RepID=UPI001F5A5A39|nr:uncharacterized protein LOC124645459 [Helicoverpa zea]
MSENDHIITYVTDLKLRSSYTRIADIMFTRPNGTRSENIIIKDITSTNEKRFSLSNRITKIPKDPESLGDIIKTQDAKAKSLATGVDRKIVVIKNGTSLNTSVSNSMNTLSISSSTSVTYNSAYCSSSLSLMSSLEGSMSSISVSDKNTSIHKPGGSNHMSTKATSPRLEYKVFKVTQTTVDEVNMTVDQSTLNTASENPNESTDVLSSLDISNIMAKILKKKRFSDASNIFIIVPTSTNSGSEAASESLKSVTSRTSKDTHVIAERCTLVDLDTPLRKTPIIQHEMKVLGKGKKFYMEEIHTSESSTEFEKESVEVLRKVEWSKNKYCQMAASTTKLQIFGKTDVDFGTDTTMDRPCCCCAKISTATFVVQNCSSSKDKYIANVMSRKSTPLFLKGKASRWFRSLGRRAPSFSTLPSDMRMCSNCGLYHKPTNHSQDECEEPNCLPCESEYFCPHIPMPCSSYTEHPNSRLKTPHVESMQLRGRVGKQLHVRPVESVGGLLCECSGTKSITVNRKVDICPRCDLLEETESGSVEGMMSKGMITDLKGFEIVDLQCNNMSPEERILFETAVKKIAAQAGTRIVEQPSEQTRRQPSEQPSSEPTQELMEQPILKSNRQPHRKKKRKNTTSQQPSEPKGCDLLEGLGEKKLTCQHLEPKELTKREPKEPTSTEPKAPTKINSKEPTKPDCLDNLVDFQKKESRKYSESKELTKREPKEHARTESNAPTKIESKKPTKPLDCFDEKKRSRHHSQSKELTKRESKEHTRTEPNKIESRKYSESKELTRSEPKEAARTESNALTKIELKEPTKPLDCFDEKKRSRHHSQPKELTKTEPEEHTRTDPKTPTEIKSKEPIKTDCACNDVAGLDKKKQGHHQHSEQKESKEPSRTKAKAPTNIKSKEPVKPDCLCDDLVDLGEKKESRKHSESKELTKREPKESTKTEFKAPTKTEPEERIKTEKKAPIKSDRAYDDLAGFDEKKESRQHSEPKELTKREPKKPTCTELKPPTKIKSKDHIKSDYDDFKGEKKKSFKLSESKELTKREPKEPIRTESKAPTQTEPKESIKAEQKAPTKSDCERNDIAGLDKNKESCQHVEPKELTKREPKPTSPEPKSPTKIKSKENRKPECDDFKGEKKKRSKHSEPKELTKRESACVSHDVISFDESRESLIKHSELKAPTESDCVCDDVGDFGVKKGSRQNLQVKAPTESDCVCDDVGDSGVKKGSRKNPQIKAPTESDCVCDDVSDFGVKNGSRKHLEPSQPTQPGCERHNVIGFDENIDPQLKAPTKSDCTCNDVRNFGIKKGSRKQPQLKAPTVSESSYNDVSDFSIKKGSRKHPQPKAPSVSESSYNDVSDFSIKKGSRKHPQPKAPIQEGSAYEGVSNFGGKKGSRKHLQVKAPTESDCVCDDVSDFGVKKGSRKYPQAKTPTESNCVCDDVEDPGVKKGSRKNLQVKASTESDCVCDDVGDFGVKKVCRKHPQLKAPTVSESSYDDVSEFSIKKVRSFIQKRSRKYLGPKVLPKSLPSGPTHPGCACYDDIGFDESKRSCNHSHLKLPTESDCVCDDVSDFSVKKGSRKYLGPKVLTKSLPSEPTRPGCSCHGETCFGVKKESRKHLESKVLNKPLLNQPTQPSCVCHDDMGYDESKESRRPKKSKVKPYAMEASSSSKGECVCHDVVNSRYSCWSGPHQISKTPRKKCRPWQLTQLLKKSKPKIKSGFSSSKEKTSSSQVDCPCSHFALQRKKEIGIRKSALKSSTCGCNECKMNNERNFSKTKKSITIIDPKYDTKPQPIDHTGLTPKCQSDSDTDKVPPVFGSGAALSENLPSKPDGNQNVHPEEMLSCECSEQEPQPKLVPQPEKVPQPQKLPQSGQVEQPEQVPEPQKVPQPEQVANLPVKPDGKQNKHKKKKILCECPEQVAQPEQEPQQVANLPQKPDEKQNEHPKKKLPCECPEQVPQTNQVPQTDQEPQPEQVAQSETPPEPQIVLEVPSAVISEEYLYPGIGPSCAWIESDEMMKLRSDLTAVKSGFRARKKKRKPNIELDFEDAIRYFACLNPEKFKELMQDELDKQVDAEVSKRKNEKKLKKKQEKEMKKLEKERKKPEKKKQKIFGIRTKKKKEALQSPETSEEITNMYPEKGFKLTIAGPCTPGPLGTLCFEMTRVAYLSW